MPMIATIAIIYFAGVMLALWMQKVEFQSAKRPYTKGLQAIIVLLALLSWLVVLFLLIAGWVVMVGATGYWSRPVHNTPVQSSTKSKEVTA